MRPLTLLALLCLAPAAQADAYSRKMLPASSADDCQNCALRHLVQFADRFVTEARGLVEKANVQYLLFSQQSAASVFASGASALCNHVLHVVVMGSEEQVVGIAAKRVVSTGAVVADFKAVRDGAESEFPGKTRRSNTFLADQEAAIAGPERAGLPEPAAIGFEDVAPEIIWDGFDLAPLITTGTGAILAAVQEVPRSCKERAVAIQTDSFDSGSVRGHAVLLTCGVSGGGLLTAAPLPLPYRPSPTAQGYLEGET